eukprot:3016942-Amphidinium_carterae.1
MMLRFLINLADVLVDHAGRKARPDLCTSPRALPKGWLLFNPFFRKQNTLFNLVHEYIYSRSVVGDFTSPGDGPLNGAR